ncbi:nicotinate-nucleotide adenylyltransferase [Chloroflexota bacterium]
MNIGVLGGTFDPIHNGHLSVAEEVRVKLKLIRVIFMPAGQPWMKEGLNPVLVAEHRVQMVRLAIVKVPYFQLSTLEIERPGPSYAVDAITELRSQIGTRYEIFSILGWDSLSQLPNWREPSRLITLCHLVVVPRPGYILPDIQSLAAKIPRLSERLIILDKPEIDISAREIRSRVAQGLPISHLVPIPVEEYIKRHRLYVTE